MSWIFFKKDFKDNLLTWIVCTCITLLLFTSMYFTAASIPSVGGIIISQTYTMFVALLPLIYIIKVGVGMIVSKVDDGSFYIDMVSCYTRKKILFTKMVYFIASIFMMYLLLTVMGLVFVVIKPFSLTYQNILLMNTMSFLLNTAMSSVVFLSSSYFNASRRALLFGAGIPIISYAFQTISGMFVNIPGLEDNTLVKMLTYLKYLSFHSLYSYDEIISATNFNWIGVGVFIGVAVLLYGASFIVFTKKDLPL